MYIKQVKKANINHAAHNSSYRTYKFAVFFPMTNHKKHNE